MPYPAGAAMTKTGASAPETSRWSSRERGTRLDGPGGGASRPAWGGDAVNGALDCVGTRRNLTHEGSPQPVEAHARSPGWNHVIPREPAIHGHGNHDDALSSRPREPESQRMARLASGATHVLRALRLLRRARDEGTISGAQYEAAVDAITTGAEDARPDA